MKNKVVLITGGNSGIGFAAAEALAQQGAKVVIAGRNVTKGQEAVAALKNRTGVEVDWLRLDLAAFVSIREAAAAFREKYARLDVLINNAGVVLSQRKLTADGFEMTMGVNHLGHFLFTQNLLSLLRESAPARVINVSSDMHRFALGGLSFQDMNSERYYWGMLAYARSKLANIYFSTALAHRMSTKGVTVNAVHPGVVATRFSADGDMSGLVPWFYQSFGRLLKTSAEGADTVVYLAAAAEVAQTSGVYFVNKRVVRPSRVARREDFAEQLWQWSEQATMQDR